ncbi:Rhodanese domain protein [Desulfurivibrio alkaliphilus AHT 2]|uniref:Rhodanese domain protein n=2 Tax=Desulfurivibrio alkaliphilus TaxID=427923 RepID=D6Z636_DESAT|nr:rhodanese-like domain-containing protein [Desulfurivibrio alkaliphilus]ADH84918.1 Rhodanese domain protein [Desulfurivibrio alkaliphilus AHT 2]
MRYKFFTILLATSICLLLAATAGARAWISDLSTEELKQRMDEPRRIVVVDTRTEQEYRQGHISGAINISSQASNQFQDIARLLPDDKEVPLVFYCRGFD